MGKALSMKLDTTSFLKRMSLADDRVWSAALVQMRINGEDLLKESGYLVPVDEGTLARSGSQRTKADRSAKTIITTVGYNTPYATKVHYEMSPAPGGKLKQGPITQAKTGSRFGAAGGLYLQRPLIGKMKHYMGEVAKAIRASLSVGGRSR